MRFCTLQTGSVGVAVDGVTRLVAPRLDDPRGLFESVMDGRRPELAGDAEADPRLGPPIRPGKVVAVGLNYRMHADESGVDAPERPLIFAKFPSSVVGPGAPIVIDPALMERVDWEVELAVVVGRRMRNVAEAD